MKKISVRRATLDDIKVIQSLNYELFLLEKKNFDATLITDWPLSEQGEEYFESLIKNGCVIVAVSGNIIIGYLAGSINDKCSYSNLQYGEINNMFIAEEYRGHGIGKRLIDRFKKYCADKNIHNLKVVASAKNSKARKFYEQQGFDEFDITFTMSVK